LAAALAAAGLLIGGCATEEYVDQQIAATNARIDQVQARAEEAHAKLASGDFQSTVLMMDDSVRFESNKSELSDSARASLANFAQRLKTENRNVHVEVVGHADSSGRTEHNLRLGQLRAEAVMRFLHTQGVPLHRMSAISYGEHMPRAANEAAAGRAENRRVVLVVMG
jgi:outer membrane protein OmpA-like peptidoglycan-associated protein